MTTTTTINVGRRLTELEEQAATAQRRCAALGWTEAVLDKLVAGADFRDLLRGETGGAR